MCISDSYGASQKTIESTVSPDGEVTIEGYGPVSYTHLAKEMVAKKGYDVQFGARPLRRAIQTYIEDSVCEMVSPGFIVPSSNISQTESSM